MMRLTKNTYRGRCAYRGNKISEDIDTKAKDCNVSDVTKMMLPEKTAAATYADNTGVSEGATGKMGHMHLYIGCNSTSIICKGSK